MPRIDEENRPSSSELVLLEPPKIKLTKGPGDSVRMVIEGWDRSYLQVRIRRAFPLTNPEHYVCINDGQEKDIGLVENPRELEKESQRIIWEELGRRYFVPEISMIHSLREEFGMSYWAVETDKGPKDFIVRGRRESLHELPGTNRVIITDVDSNRYDVPDMLALDKKSYALLSKVLY